MTTLEAVKLNNSELKDAVGGGVEIYHKMFTTDVYDTRGRYCGKVQKDTVYYWPCKHCGRPTHMGSGFHQCDKCDDWFWTIGDTRYNGTVEELQAASAAN